MTRYIETIKVENGEVQNLEFHQARIVRTIGRQLDICSNIPNQYRLGIVKYRIVYDAKGILNIAYSHYTPSVINTLKIVECNDVNYDFKYEDRTQIESLMALRGDCDDIVIVRNGFVTDSSYCNILFSNSQGIFTSDTPLLAGTKREELIKNNRIQVVPIAVGDIQNYDKIILINAMTKFELTVDSIRV